MTKKTTNRKVQPNGVNFQSPTQDQEMALDSNGATYNQRSQYHCLQHREILPRGFKYGFWMMVFFLAIASYIHFTQQQGLFFNDISLIFAMGFFMKFFKDCYLFCSERRPVSRGRKAVLSWVLCIVLLLTSISLCLKFLTEGSIWVLAMVTFCSCTSSCISMVAIRQTALHYGLTGTPEYDMPIVIDGAVLWIVGKVCRAAKAVYVVLVAPFT